MATGTGRRDDGQATVEAIMAFFFFFVILFGIIEAGHLTYSVSAANAQIQKVGTGLSTEDLSQGDAAATIKSQIVESSAIFASSDVVVSNVTVREPRKLNSSQAADPPPGYSMSYTIQKNELVVEYDVSCRVPLLFKLFSLESVEMTRHVEYDIPTQSAYEVTG